jgi:hypothetical protein
MEPDVKKRFELAARALGKREYEVVDELVRAWLGQVEGQLRLHGFFEQPQPVLIHADTVNLVARKATVLQVKEKLRHTVQVLGKVDLDKPGLWYWRSELYKALGKAALLPQEARDEELQKLAEEAEELLTR